MSLLRYKFHKAFTLAELMVILAVMSVVFAAVAPVFTSQYNRLMSDEVWHEVSADDNLDIYADAPQHFMSQEVMIGLSPLDLEDVKTNYAPLSKLIVRSSDRIGGLLAGTVQKPIEFYYNGEKMGYLAAGRDNFMLAGEYSAITNNARGNTAYGFQALNAITSGSGNTAVGAGSLGRLTTGQYNTAVGGNSGSTANGEGNVFIGYNVSSTGNYNTIISNNSNGSGDYTTAIGNGALYSGDYNVVLGTGANGTGSFNTAIGSYAMQNAGNSVTYRNNTAIGYKSCSQLGANAQNKTCIGQAATTNSANYGTVGGAAVNETNQDVLIGRGVSHYLGGSAATVVVRNSNSTSYDDLNDATVVVYGNLIVRGQTYMYGKSPFPVGATPNYTPPRNDALMGYTLFNEAPGDHKPLIGFDGSSVSVQLQDDEAYIRQVYAGKEHCICSYTGSPFGGGGYSSAGTQSYDWSGIYDLPNRYETNNHGEYSYYWSGNFDDTNIELNRAHSLYGFSENTGSCCPILTTSTFRRDMSSDLRLKNVQGNFSSGLADLIKLNIYNFTFKSDKNSTPQVGVIAQDLKAVFPEAVSKGEKGYYKVRWDEMFYSAVNSVKELNEKIVSLISRVENDIKRIEQLKRENKELEQKVLILAQEVEKLENKK